MKVKPGDTAIITGSATTPENIGRIVTVIGPADSNTLFRSVRGFGAKMLPPVTRISFWRVRATRPLKWFPAVEKYLEIPVRDCHLRPVSGLDLSAAVTDPYSGVRRGGDRGAD